MFVRRVCLTTFAALAFIVQPLAGLERASAQIPVNPDSVGLYESFDGRAPELAGEIYREGIDPGHYTEHWVLYANYVYPSADNGAVVSLKPGFKRYDDASQFLERVPFDAGARYVKVDCLDGTKLPLVDPPSPDKPNRSSHPRAQIMEDVESVGIWVSFHGGEAELAGEIFREGGDPGHYVEHWVLFPNYAYPSLDNGAVVTLDPGYQRYASAPDFLARVPFAKGSRYVAADCDDSSQLPGR